MFNATAGLACYNALWGVGLKHANDAVNFNTDTSGRNYHELLTGKEYKYDIGGRDLSFGQQVFYHLKDEQLLDDWATSGQEAIWVGRSNSISGGHRIVPIKWDPTNNIYTLFPSREVNNIRFENIKYPLRMGPVQDDSEFNKFEEYVEEFFKPWYKFSSKDF